MWQRKSEGWHFYVLGSSGGKAKKRHTMCIYLPPSILLDAGNVFSLDEDALLRVNHIFLTHSHLDHLVDIPFLIDYTYNLREKPLSIYGLPQTIEALRKNIMNWDVWPEFGSLKLPLTEEYAIEYRELSPGCELEVEGYTILPLTSKHTVPTLSLIVKKDGRGFAYTSDTHRNPTLWHTVQEDPDIRVVLVDVSFPSYMSKLAKASLHNTPESLMEDMSLLRRGGVRVYAVHIKPACEGEVVAELRKMSRRVVPILGRKKIKV